jgi:hypothetical protein
MRSLPMRHGGLPGGKIGVPMIIRRVLAVVAGFVTGGLLIFVGAQAGHLIWPPPEGLAELLMSGERNDYEKARSILASASPLVFVPVLMAYALGAFGGGMVGARLAPRSPLWHALVVGVLLTIVNSLNVVFVPQPLWVTIVSFVIFVPVALMGGMCIPRTAPVKAIV